MSGAIRFILACTFWPIRRFIRLSVKKKVIVLIFFIIAFFIGYQALSSSTAKPDYTSATATKNDIVEIVSETGSIATSNKIDIYSPATGIVQDVTVKNGEHVTAGQLLFTVISTASDEEKAAALADYLTAKNTLETANATLYSLQSTMFTKWDIFKELAESDTYEETNGAPKYNQRALPEFHIAEKDWLAAEANFKKQQGVIAQAQANLKSKQLAYQSTQNASIKAPAAGTVANISVTTEAGVSAYSPTVSSVPLATIANFSSTEVVVPFSETDIAKISPGQSATIEVNSVRGRTYSGTVARVDEIGTTISGVVRYRVYISLSNADDKLRPGMGADIDIITKKEDNVLSVPNSAIKPYQNGKAVRVYNQKSKKIEYVPVEIGIKGKENTQIIKGLSDGQEIVLSLSNEQLKRPGFFGN